MKNTSITIVGAGPVGSIFALRLAQHGIPVTLLDKRHAQDVMVTEFDRRAYALSHGTVTFLKQNHSPKHCTLGRDLYTRRTH